MARLILIFVSALLALTLPAWSALQIVTVQNFSYTPANVTILPTDTVRWTKAAAAGTHNVHHNATPSLFGNAISGSAWTYEVRFDSIAADTVPPIGTYNYFCQVHGMGMTGNVLVRSLWVSAPATGASWNVGDNQTISWSSGNLTGNVSIELNRDFPGGAWETLFANATNDGSENWMVSGPASTNARIRVSSLSFPSVSDVSCCDLALVEPAVAMVFSPNGGEVWYEGEQHGLQWIVSLPGPVMLELNRSYPAEAWETLFASADNDGFEPWVVSGTASTTCRVRVTSLDNGAVNDISDADFAIAAFNAPQELTAISSGADIVLNWLPVDGATTYSVYKSVTSPDAGFVFLFSVADTTYTDVGAANSQAMSFYRVQADRNIELTSGATGNQH